MAKEYFYVGTYPDGVKRTGHVHTTDIEGWIAYMTQGVLPFATVHAVPCDAPTFGACDH